LEGCGSKQGKAWVFNEPSLGLCRPRLIQERPSPLRRQTTVCGTAGAALKARSL